MSLILESLSEVRRHCDKVPQPMLIDFSRADSRPLTLAISEFID